MRSPFIALVPSLILLIVGAARAADQDTGQLALTLDRQLPREHIEFSGAVPQALQTLSNLTGVRFLVGGTVYETLPWGDRTTLRATFEHQTLRQALSAICRKLGLQYALIDQTTIELRPLPALVRIGRRCTLEELAAIDLLDRIALGPAELRLPAANLATAIDAKLAGSGYAVQDRAFAPDDPTDIAVARNFTLLDALDEIARQTDATWCPLGNRIVIQKKIDQIHMQLGRRITMRFDHEDIGQVLLDLSQRSGIDMLIEPGALQKIAPPLRTIRLVLDNASVEQAMQSICGFTGLAFDVTDRGVRIWYAMSPATQPASN